MAGKITLNPETSDIDGSKAVQVKVPVVATVMQNIEPDGKSVFVVEPPGAEHEQGKLSCLILVALIGVSALSFSRPPFFPLLFYTYPLSA